MPTELAAKTPSEESSEDGGDADEAEEVHMVGPHTGGTGGLTPRADPRRGSAVA